LQAYREACDVFNCIIHKERERNFVPKTDRKINYCNLLHGTLSEVRYVFARVVFDTMFPPNLENNDQDTVPEDWPATYHTEFL
jgi:hypothetical protein